LSKDKKSATDYSDSESISKSYGSVSHSCSLSNESELNALRKRKKCEVEEHDKCLHESNTNDKIDMLNSILMGRSHTKFKK